MNDPVSGFDTITLLVYECGRRDALHEAADLLKLSSAQIRLAAGELTAQEMRAVKAVLAWREHEIRSKADE